MRLFVLLQIKAKNSGEHIMVFSKAATSLMCNFSNGNFPKVMSGPPRRLSLQWGPRATARPDLGSFRLGNCTFEKLPLEKIPLENCHLEKNYFFNICCHNTNLRTCLAFLIASVLLQHRLEDRVCSYCSQTVQLTICVHLSWAFLVYSSMVPSSLKSLNEICSVQEFINNKICSVQEFINNEICSVQEFMNNEMKSLHEHLETVRQQKINIEEEKNQF